MSGKTTTISILKIGAIYTFSNVIVKGIAFLTTPLFTRLMTQSEYGEFNSIASWANIISVIVTFNLHASINRAKYDYKNNINKYMSSIVLLGSLISGICWLFMECNIRTFEKIFFMDRVYIRSIMFYSMLSPAIQILLTKYRMFNEYKKVIVITWITLFASTGCSLGLVFIMSNKLLGRVLGNYTVVALVDVVFWAAIIIKGRCFSFEYCKYALILALPLIPHELSAILLNSSDRIIIKQLCGAEDAALYSLAYTIGMIMTVLLSSLNQAWVPWFYDHLSINKTQDIGKASKWYLFIFTFGCVGLMLIGPELVLLFGGSGYMSAVYVIPPVCIAIELQFIYTLYVNVEFYVKKTLMISIATISATIVNIALNYMLIPIFGYIAAAYTTILGYVLMAVFHYCVVLKKTAYGNLFEKKYIILACVFCSIGMVGAMMLYETRLIRYLIILIYIGVIMIVMYKKTLGLSDGD